MENNELTYRDGYSPQIARFVAMFDNNRERLLYKLKDVTDEILDFTPDEKTVETIGTLLYHIAAVEHDWIFYDIDKQEIDEERWKYAFATRSDDIDQLKGKGLQFYLDALQEVRDKIFNRFKKFSDNDLKRSIESEGKTFTIEWILFHLLNHEAVHIGQISLLKRLYRLREK